MNGLSLYVLNSFIPRGYSKNNNILQTNFIIKYKISLLIKLFTEKTSDTLFIFMKNQTFSHGEDFQRGPQNKNNNSCTVLRYYIAFHGRQTNQHNITE